MEIFAMLFQMEAIEIERPKNHSIAVIVNRIINMEDEFRD